jgi:hypothetical protein
VQPRSHCLLITATILILALTATHRHITSVVAATTPHPVLIELFTSEGCSSCPPADTLLRQINGMHTDTGQLIVGVSEHVTYWNNLGWNDPYSTSTFTDRQNSYGMRFHLDSVYTPQIVVNGERQVLGSDRSAVLRAVQETDHPSQLKVQIVSTTVSGDTLTISYAIRETSSSEGADLFAILADDVDTSNVLRGENSGRTITHVSVARNLTHIGTIHDGTENVIQLPLANTRHSAQHLILFAQAKHLGPVLSVDTAPLN